jgi:endonuclease/exonuclease/phosphatase family metal-dependent hydrolase
VFEMSRLIQLIIVGLVVLLTGCPKKETTPRVEKTIASPTPAESVNSNPDPVKSHSKEKPTVVSVGQEFSVVAYNVENLFDVDGEALFEDYQSDKWKASHLLVKVQNIAKVLQAIQGGNGPQIVLFQELEADQTPGATPPDYDAIMKKYADKSLQAMVSDPVSPEVKDLPVEVFLLKALSEAGLQPYHVSVGEYRPDPLGRTVAHVNATFSQFPIVESRTHQSPGARGTLEVVHQIGEHRLHTFSNHWKSGASDAQEELIRLGNAQVVRDRLTEILKTDPHADVVLGGDFNSQYNQSRRFPEMKKTAINTVLGSQGNELAIREPGGPDLYNLWYELPPNQRRSDAYQGYWGTLMNLMISRGLYDLNGVQYVDNSLRLVAIDNLNAQLGTGLPFRWRTLQGTGTGYSDHLPIEARFRLVDDNDRQSFLQLDKPGAEGNSEEETSGFKANYANIPSSSLTKTKDIGSDAAMQRPELIGQLFLVDAEVVAEQPLRIKLYKDELKLWSHDLNLRKEIYKRFPVGSKMTFIGEFDFHDGMWQFVVHDASWLDP